MEEVRCQTILELHNAGNRILDIVRVTKYPHTTVRDVIKHFQVTGSNTRKPRGTPPANKVRHDNFVAELKDAIDNSPCTSMQSLARERGVSEAIIRRAAKDNIGYKSYILRVRHLLTDSLKEKRLTLSKHLLAKLKNSQAGQIHFFTDEKLFKVDRKTNRHNARWLVGNPEEVPFVYQGKNPASIMCFGIMGSTDHAMVWFFEQGTRVNTEEYLKLLEAKVKPWMGNVAAGCPCVFQQDGAPADTSKTTLTWLEDNFSDFWDKKTWLPSSPNLYPCDYFL